MDIKKPLVSIIIPTYNSVSYIERCLNSILNQSFKDFEVIIVDDLSTDKTIDLLNSYIKKFESMKIFSTKAKLMAGGARNIGIDYSKGKYISFVDHDDWLDTNFYYYMVKSIQKKHVDVAVCGVKREYDNAKNSSIRYQYNTENILDGKYALTLLSRMIDQDISISSIVCNKLFKSKLIKEGKHKFFNNCFNEDDIFTFNILLDARKVSITDKTYYHLYQRRNSASRNFTKKHIDDLFFAFNNIRSTLLKREIFVQYRKHYYSFFEKCFSYLLESMRSSEQDDEIINEYFKYAYSISKDAILFDEFIDYCGNRRLETFVTS